MANYFTDRVVQYPGRVTMTPTGNTNEYDLARAEGNITVAGTPFNADAFNGIADQMILAAVNQARSEILGVLDDYVTEEGTSGSWTYRKWNSGKIEAWGSYSFAAKQGTSWTAGLYYSDETVSIPSGIFTAAPKKYVTASSSQWSPCSAWGSTTTSMTIRFTKPNANSSAGGAFIYLVQN